MSLSLSVPQKIVSHDSRLTKYLRVIHNGVNYSAVQLLSKRQHNTLKMVRKAIKLEVINVHNFAKKTIVFSRFFTVFCPIFDHNLSDIYTLLSRHFKGYAYVLNMFMLFFSLDVITQSTFCSQRVTKSAQKECFARGTNEPSDE